MDKDKLDKKLRELKAPGPLKKNEAIRAAMDEFSLAQEKNTKGIPAEDRPKDRKPKGGSIMDEMKISWGRLAEYAVAFTVIVIVATVAMPAFLGQSKKSKQRAVEIGRQTKAVQTEVQQPSVEAPEAPERYADSSADSNMGSDIKPAPALHAEPVKSAKAPAEAKLKEQLVEMEEVAGRGYEVPMLARTKVGKTEQRAMYKSVPAGSSPMPSYSDRIAVQPQLSQEYVGRDRFEHKDINPVKLVSEEPVSTFSIDVDTTSYSFVRRALMEGHLPQKDSVRVEEMINYFDYDYEVPRDRSKPFKPTVAVYPTPWNSETKLLHIGIKGYELEAAKRPRANLVFLIDVSGSMGSPDKLPLLKQSLRMLVENLAPKDSVAIVVYAGAAGKVLDPTSVKDKGKILEALDRLQAGGSTAGGEGIRLAYSLAEASFEKDAVNRVILATDGDFNVGIRDPEELKGFVERKRETGVSLSVLGFGQGNYNDALMQKLAQNGNGNAAYIDTLSEARKVLVEEAGSTLFTIAGDVKIQVEFNPEQVAEYRLIGYETRMLKREDFNNDAVDAGDVGAGHSVTAIYEITPTGSDARLVDDLRYGESATGRSKKKQGEYAFLKIRYKLPGEDKSRLITEPIGSGQMYDSVKAVPEDMRFAASVGAFGQLLRGTPYTGAFSYDDVLELARASRGDDPFGYRSEFLRLVGLAKSARAMGDR